MRSRGATTASPTAATASAPARSSRRSLVALAHGTNDAQKTMGVITLALISAGWQPAGSRDPSRGSSSSCAVAIALGTYMGGWRIIRTLGTGLTDVKPAQGFAAETSTAATILASTHLGFALSTTQVASGSVIGSGLGRRGSKVRWRTAGRIGVGWLLTLPAAGHRRRARSVRRARSASVGIILDTIVARRRHRGHLPAGRVATRSPPQRGERGRRLGPRREDQAQPQAQEEGGAVIDWLAFLLVLVSALARDGRRREHLLARPPPADRVGSHADRHPGGVHRRDRRRHARPRRRPPRRRRPRRRRRARSPTGRSARRSSAPGCASSSSASAAVVGIYLIVPVLHGFLN